MNQAITNLEISIRCFNFLQAHNLTTLEQIGKLDKWNVFYKLHGCNLKIMKEVCTLFSENNLIWKNDFKPENTETLRKVDDNFLDMVYGVAQHHNRDEFREYFKEKIKHYKL